jgi:hypothetical protein
MSAILLARVGDSHCVLGAGAPTGTQQTAGASPAEIGSKILDQDIGLVVGALRALVGAADF